MDARLYRHELKVGGAQAGKRLDTFLLAFPFSEFDPALAPSRTFLQKWIAEGCVRVNGSVCADKSYRVRLGDRVSIEVAIPAEPDGPPPEPLDIRIVHSDPHFVVLDKPPGITSHPVPRALTGSVVNFLRHQRIPSPPSSHPLRPGIVHRLDKNTSGLMVVACTDMSQAELIEMIKRREVDRSYLALVFGAPPMSEGTVEAPMRRHVKDRRKMAVSRDRTAKPARTHYRVLTRYPGFSLLACTLDTGRTHQIRVHMSHIGYPIAGDPQYGGRRAHERVDRVLKSMSNRDPDYSRIERILHRAAEIITADQVHLLHAARLSFPHPITREPLSFSAEPHEKFREVIRLLETLPKDVAPPTGVLGGWRCLGNAL